ncbi:hypothetical protein [Chitinolyticbacter meiyuanensis]|uniref:hypothetical protein n=1 Tax=Chitinolyticbacter meiyuanensis TaxID=682798 RepID=UPI0011E5BB4D|nr:hypothetical protein [Chitinolyticbacter meiyuanensis]
MGPVCLTAPTGLRERLLARLSRAGCPADWSGETPPSPWAAEALHLNVGGIACSKPPPFSVDIAIMLDHPAAERLGWMLAVGGHASALQRAIPWLDALSPTPAGWLHVGSDGAGAFIGTANALWAEQQQQVVAWLAERGPHGTAHFDPASWQALASHTQHQLQLLAAAYLAKQPAEHELATRLALAISTLYPQNQT